MLIAAREDLTKAPKEKSFVFMILEIEDPQSETGRKLEAWPAKVVRAHEPENPRSKLDLQTYTTPFGQQASLNVHPAVITWDYPLGGCWARRSDRAAGKIALDTICEWAKKNA